MALADFVITHIEVSSEYHRTTRREEHSLVDIPPHVIPAIHSVLRAHHLVRVPREVNVKCRHEERPRRGREKVKEPFWSRSRQYAPPGPRVRIERTEMLALTRDTGR